MSRSTKSPVPSAETEPHGGGSGFSPAAATDGAVGRRTGRSFLPVAFPLPLLAIAVTLASATHPLVGPHSLAAQTADSEARTDTAFDLVASGSTHFRAGRFEEAAADFLGAARRMPHHPGWAYNASLALAEAGRPVEALLWLNRVADLGATYDLDVEPLEELRGEPGFEKVRERFEGLRAPTGYSELAFAVTERDLLPESVARDPRDGSFYMGSIHRRKIVRIAPDGSVTDFVEEGEHGLWGVLGMKLDSVRRELWANACNLGDDMPMAVPEPGTEGRGGVFRFDLETGDLVRKYVAGSDSTDVCFNDLALAPDGSVYVSSGDRGVYRIGAADTLDHVLRPPGLAVNGLTVAEDGRRLYLANGSRGVALADPELGTWRTVTLPADATLNWIDGLYLHRGALVGVQNGLRPRRIVRAPLDSTGTRVTDIEVLERGNRIFAGPTTGTVVGDTLFYVATTQLRSFDDEGRIFPLERLEDNLVLKLALPSR